MKKALTILIIVMIFNIGLALILFGLRSPKSITREILPELPGAEVAEVIHVTDGDTIDVDIKGKKHTIRFIGMDTPETKDPRKSVQCYGPEASTQTTQILEGKMIYLVKDIEDTDKYDRSLRYVYMKYQDKFLFVNDYLVRNGFAKVLSIAPNTAFQKRFLEAEQEASSAKKGLWGKCI